ncbi:MAG: PDZ domain-containing protein, partial [Polyangia bacterium]
DVVLRLPATGTLFGTLVGFANPPQVVATRVLPDRYSPMLDVLVNGDHFTLPDLSPGRYQVAALGGESDALTVDIAAGATASVTLQNRGTATVRGRVLELRSGDPVPGIHCTVLLGTAVERPTLDLPAGAITDEEGRFELSAPVGRPAIECFGDWSVSTGAVVASLAAGEVADEEIWVVRRQGGEFHGWIGAHADRTLLGFRVTSVVPKGPADRAGLRAGDRVISVDGRAVDRLSKDGIWFLLFDRPIGATAQVGIARGSATFTTGVTIGSLGE